MTGRLPAHPLDRLTADEIRRARVLLHEADLLTDRTAIALLLERCR